MADERDGKADERDGMADHETKDGKQRLALARELRLALPVRDRTQEELLAVTAHTILNSATVLALGISVVQQRLDGVLDPDTASLLQKMNDHVETVVAGLTGLVLGRHRTAS